jgi:hypothetical protein
MTQQASAERVITLMTPNDIRLGDVVLMKVRISYPRTHYSNGTAWGHLLANAPEVTYNGKTYYPFFEPNDNAPPGKSYNLNPYRKSHDDDTCGWIVRKWVQRAPPVRRPKVPKPKFKSRYQHLIEDDWLDGQKTL